MKSCIAVALAALFWAIPALGVQAIPQALTGAMMSAPEGAVVGIGAASMESATLSRISAEYRARAEIHRQLGVVIMNMVANYMGGAQANPMTMMMFQESAMGALHRSELNAAVIIAHSAEAGGEHWAAAMLGGTDAAAEIMNAARYAAGRVPGVSATMWNMDFIMMALQFR